MTPERRTMRAQIAAHTRWSRIEGDPAAHTAKAREAFLRRFELEVDPEGILTAKERQRRAEHARKAYFRKPALRSSQARARK